jgi:hypothetical protein
LERPIGDLKARFIVAPFTVLDTRSAWWQERKRGWLALGIKSEIGRRDNPLRYSETIRQPDPKKRNRVYIAPAALKVDLNVPGMEATPIERIEGALPLWVKRDDKFEIAGVRGGKVRTCWSLAQGAIGLTTSGSRSSPQVNIVAHIAWALQIPCRVHTPQGELGPEVSQARDFGAEVVQHKAGYNNVIIARARDDAAQRGWKEIPFGMECIEALRQTGAQYLATDIPTEVDRIVIPVGSGMSLAGLLHGLAQSDRQIRVLGIMVGADPIQRLDKYAPAKWREQVELIRSPYPYDKAIHKSIGGIKLDSIYEAKCVDYLKVGDLFWLIGIRASEAQSSRTA